MSIRPAILLACLGWAPALDARAVTLDFVPDVRTLLTNAVRRAAQTNRLDGYVFTRVRTLDELDSKGGVKSSKEETHFVRHHLGRPFEKLIARDGRALPAKDAAREAKREADFFAGHHAPEKRPDRQIEFTDKLLKRYEFQLVGSELVGRRPAWKIRFSPRAQAGSPANLVEEALGKIEGHVWIDAEDRELSRVELRLTESITILAGLIGSLSRFELNHERERIAPGIWLTGRTVLELTARKLLTPIRLRVREEGKDFQAAAAEATAPPTPAP